jgi:hypothetical protein
MRSGYSDAMRGGVGATFSSPTKKKAFQVLGDLSEYEVKLAEVTLPPPPPEPDTVHNTDHREFPEEIWEAACISPDQGAAMIRAYREIAKTRCVALERARRGAYMHACVSACGVDGCSPPRASCMACCC